MHISVEEIREKLCDKMCLHISCEPLFIAVELQYSVYRKKI